MNGKYKWVDFLSNKNTLMITNEKEFNQFKKFLQMIKMSDILRKDTQFSDWQHLANINGNNPNCILFEYDNSKGLTFGYTVETSKNWYDKEPFTIKDIELLSDISKHQEAIDRGL